MHQNSKNSRHSRRGFFQSLLSDFVPKSAVETDKQRALKQRASILALKYGKTKALLAKIGVKSPVRIDDTHFRVEITGRDATGETHNLELEVDSETEVVKLFEAEPSASQGNSES